MRTDTDKYEVPAVTPDLQEHDWTHEHEDDEAIVLWIDATRPPVFRPVVETPRDDN